MTEDWMEKMRKDEEPKHKKIVLAACCGRCDHASDSNHIENSDGSYVKLGDDERMCYWLFRNCVVKIYWVCSDFYPIQGIGT